MTADPLFYEIFKEIPELFFELIGQPGKNPSIYKFSALEIKQRGFRLDGLLSTLEAYPNEPIYFIEAQSYKDDNFYNQFVGEVILYLTQYQPRNQDWYAIVIYDTKSNEGNFPGYLNFFKKRNEGSFGALERNLYLRLKCLCSMGKNLEVVLQKN